MTDSCQPDLVDNYNSSTWLTTVLSRIPNQTCFPFPGGRGVPMEREWAGHHTHLFTYIFNSLETT